MILKLSAPSKTFLIGEYAVLAGGPALLLNTAPRFALVATRGQGPAILGIPAGSPAAKWLEPRSSMLREWKLEFQDPHQGQGGFGASSAQFLFVHALTTFLQISVSRAVEGMDREALYNDFQTLTGGEASGADLMGQTAGQVTFVDRSFAEARPWPFPELNFAIVRTQNKVATHAHLRQLDRAPLASLLPVAHACIENFSPGRAEMFVNQVKAYGKALQELSLQSAATRTMLESAQRQPWCLAAKGCGAMGADTILLLFAKNQTSEVRSFFEEKAWHCVATAADLGAGLEMNWSWN